MLSGLLLGAFAAAQAADISLELHTAQNNFKPLPLIAAADDPSSSQRLRLDLQHGRIDLAVGKLVADPGQSAAFYDEPLFCFEAPGSSSGIGLHATDANGHVVIDGLALGSSTPLMYVHGVRTAEIKPTVSSHCFYRGTGGTGSNGLGPLGWYGQPPAKDDDLGPQILHADNFEAVSRLHIEYLETFGYGLPDQAGGGQQLRYYLLVQNKGHLPVDQAALQEVFPANPDVYASALSEGRWKCHSQQHCPNPVWTQGPLRWEGLALAPGESIGFEIERQVLASGPGRIHLHAAVVDTLGGLNPSFDTVSHEIQVVSGSPSQLQFVSEPATGEFMLPNTPFNPAIALHVLDSNGQLATSDNHTEVQLQLIYQFPSGSTGLSNVPAGELAQATASNGVVSFDFGDGAGPMLPPGSQLQTGHYYLLASVADGNGVFTSSQSGCGGTSQPACPAMSNVFMIKVVP